MDDADMAAVRAERFEPYLIEASRKPDGPPPTGACLYCSEKLLFSDSARWCDAICRNAYEREDSLKRNKK